MGIEDKPSRGSNRSKGTRIIIGSMGQYQLPYIDRIVFTIANSRIIAAKTGAGESDLQAHSSFDDYTFLKANEAANITRLLWRTGPGSWRSIPTSTSMTRCGGLMRDVRFRRALSLAVNRHDQPGDLFGWRSRDRTRCCRKARFTARNIAQLATLISTKPTNSTCSASTRERRNAPPAGRAPARHHRRGSGNRGRSPTSSELILRFAVDRHQAVFQALPADPVSASVFRPDADVARQRHRERPRHRRHVVLNLPDDPAAAEWPNGVNTPKPPDGRRAARPAGGDPAQGALRIPARRGEQRQACAGVARNAADLADQCLRSGLSPVSSSRLSSMRSCAMYRPMECTTGIPAPISACTSRTGFGSINPPRRPPRPR